MSHASTKRASGYTLSRSASWSSRWPTKEDRIPWSRWGGANGHAVWPVLSPPRGHNHCFQYFLQLFAQVSQSAPPELPCVKPVTFFRLESHIGQSGRH